MPMNLGGLLVHFWEPLQEIGFLQSGPKSSKSTDRTSYSGVRIMLEVTLTAFLRTERDSEG